MLNNTFSSRDNTKLAAMIILATVFAISMGDALIKQVSANLGLWQMFVLRSLLALLALLAFLRARLPSIPLLPVTIGWTVLRSLLLALMWVIYYASLPHLQLSIAAATYYTLPIFITLFSALFAGEKVNLSGWFAIALGFCGVTLILDPSKDDFNYYALLPLLSAMLYAIAMMLTRTKCRNEHPLILASVLHITFIFIGLIGTFSVILVNHTEVSPSFLTHYWLPMSNNEIMAIILLAAVALIASIGTAVAYQIGKSFVVATFDFAYVGFAVIWSVVFFAEPPSIMTVGGIILIVASGIVAVRQ